VGASLLANVVDQSAYVQLTESLREQARSHKGNAFQL
jgi:hypothetical protein